MPILEKLDEKHAGQKSADVSPDSDTATQIRAILKLRQCGDYLPEKPPDENEPRRDGNDLEEDYEEEEHPHPDPRIQDEVSAENPGYGARRSDRWQWGRWLRQNVRKCRGQSANEIENQKSSMPEAVFDVIAEHPEKERVAEDVSPSAVEKHRKNWREDVDPVIIDYACHSSPEWHRRTDGRHVGELSRYHAEVADTGRQYLGIEAGALYDNPGRKHREEDEIRHPWRADGREFVA
jgi:hypothetical protein